MIREDEIEDINILLHALINAVRFPGAWSEKLNNIPPIDLQLMSLVSMNPDIIIKEIRDIMDLPGSTVTSSINRLTDRGWLKRVPSSRDRRSFSLVLTGRGEEIQKEHDRVDRVIAFNMLNSLPDGKERKKLISLLKKVVKGMEGSYFQELIRWIRNKEIERENESSESI